MQNHESSEGLREFQAEEWMTNASMLVETPVLPKEAVDGMTLDLMRRLDCYVPTRECEAVGAGLVLALQRSGWKFYRP